MKKKLLLLSLVVISCVCVAFGLTGCKHSHTLVKTDEIAATCTTDGQEAYWTCSDSSCGKMFSDAEGTTEITAPIVIPATGHSYAATFEWTAATEGGYTAAATLTCSACNDTQTVTATVTSETTAATCTADGSIVYTATAAYDGETYTDTKTVTLAAAHSYSEDWSSDGTSHWHACTACDATTDVAEHTFVEDEDGNYVCSVCGKTVTSYITGSDTLALGDNYVYLASSSSYIYADITYTVPADSDGLYTFTISEDCQAWVTIEDANYDRYTIGTTGSTDDVYSVSIVAAAGDVLNMYCIYAIDDADFTNYVFNVNLTYTAATIGSEVAPYSLSGNKEVTIAAGEKYYFSVAGYNSLRQIYVTNSGLDLYLNGTKLTLTQDSSDNYCYYFYAVSGTTYTFYLANDTTASITDKVYYSSYYTDNLVAGTNTLTIDSSMLDGSGYIYYKITVPANTAYTLTLGTDTDSSVAIKSGSSSSATLYLGYGSEATSYVFGNSRTYSNPQYFYIQYTGEATSFKVVLVFTEYTETIDDKDSEATYAALTIDTALTCTPVACTYLTVSTYNKVYLSYTVEEAGHYTLSFEMLYSTYDYTSSLTSSKVTYYLNGTEVTGNGSYCELSLVAGENKIIVKIDISSMSSYTLSATITDDKDNLAIGSNTISIAESEAYWGHDSTFTATSTGLYTFSFDGDCWAMIDGVDDSFYDEGEYEVYLYAGDEIAINFATYSGDAAAYTLTIACDTTATSPYTTLATGDNSVTSTSKWYSVTYVMTVEVSNEYTFTMSGYDGIDGASVDIGAGLSDYYYVSLNDNTDTDTVTLPAGTYRIYVYGAGTYTLTITAAELPTSGSFTLEAYEDYAFTAAVAGTYTFTLSGDTSYASVWAGESDYYSSWTATYLDVQSAGVTYFTVDLEAGESITLYLTGSDGCTVSWSIGTTGSGDNESDDYTLSVGSNSISFTAAAAYTGAYYTLTVSESGTYTFSVDDNTNAYVEYSTSYRITPNNDNFSVSLTAGTEYTILVAGYSSGVAASYTLTIALAE